MINKFLHTLFIICSCKHTMSSNRILLDYDTCNEEKIVIANEIIDTYNLPLSAEQILLAYGKIRNTGYFFGKMCELNLIFLLDKILNTNINMYIAIIIASCSNFSTSKLLDLMIYRDGSNECIDVGLNRLNIFDSYCMLLYYYDFDISNTPNIDSYSRKKIEEYRFEIHGGKLTKSAVKK